MATDFDIGSQLNEIITSFSEELQAEIDKITDEETEHLISLIKEKSPKKTGKYQKGWTKKLKKTARKYKVNTVYNSKRPQITHIEEWGHNQQTAEGNIFVPGKPHIWPAYEEVSKVYVDRMKEALEIASNKNK